MIKEMGQVLSMMKNMNKIQAEMGKLQQRIGLITAEGVAGGNMVTVKMNGNMEMLSCTITDAAWQMQDKELLEDLVRGATNQAIEKVKKMVADETGQMTQSLGMPGGGALPGMPDLSSLMGS